MQERATSAFAKGTEQRKLMIVIDARSGRGRQADIRLLHGFGGSERVDVQTTESVDGVDHLEVDWTPGSATGKTIVVQNRAGRRSTRTRLIRRAAYWESIARCEIGTRDPQKLRSVVESLMIADHAELEAADALVSSSPLVVKHATRGILRDCNVMPARQALALAGLHLRLRGEFAYALERNFSASTTRTSFYQSMAFELVPEARRWTTISALAAEPRILPLAEALVVRLDRTLRARDQLHGAALSEQSLEAMEEVLFYLDSLLVALQGAFDATARVVHIAAGVSKPKIRQANWLHKSWRDAVFASIPKLKRMFDHETEALALLKVLGALRNTVHGETLRISGWLDGASAPIEYRAQVPSEDREEFVSAIDELGGASSWGITTVDGDIMIFDPASFTEALVPAAAGVLNVVMATTPIDKIFLDASTTVRSPGRPSDEAHAIWSMRVLSGLDRPPTWVRRL